LQGIKVCRGQWPWAYCLTNNIIRRNAVFFKNTPLPYAQGFLFLRNRTLRYACLHQNHAVVIFNGFNCREKPIAMCLVVYCFPMNNASKMTSVRFLFYYFQ